MKHTFILLLLFINLQAIAQVTMTDYDLWVGSGSSNPNHFMAFNSKLYFTANDSVHGTELWVTDGTNTPTMAYDMKAGTADGVSAYDFKTMCVIGSKLYLAANNGTSGMELFAFDGSTTPTLATDIETGTASSSPYDMVTISNKLYFSATTTANGRELWMYDPAGSGTTSRLTDISAGATSSDVANLTVFGGKIYFTATGTATGNELYVLNPASGTATLATDIETGTGSSNPANLYVYAGKMYFTANTTANGYEVYSYTGSGSPTRLTDINPGNGSSFFSNRDALIGFYGKLYFSATADVTTFNLYQMDLATGIAIPLSLATQTSPGSFVQYGYRLYYRGTDATNGQEVFAYDGLAVALVKDIAAGGGSSFMSNPYVFNKQLYFSAGNGSTGYELHKISDPLAGIKDTWLSSAITIFPNPAKNEVHVNINLAKSAELAMTVTDITGTQLYRSGPVNYDAGSKTVTIPTRALATGNYILQVTGADGTNAAYKLMID